MSERLKCNMHHRCTKCFLFSHKSVSLFISSSHSRAVFRERRFPYTPIEYSKKVTIRTSTEQVLIARILKLHFMSAHTETILCLLFLAINHLSDHMNCNRVVSSRRLVNEALTWQYDDYFWRHWSWGIFSTGVTIQMTGVTFWEQFRG